MLAGQMVEKLQDESEHVRDTSAWSLGKTLGKTLLRHMLCSGGFEGR